jgi:hypothetical protein
LKKSELFLILVQNINKINGEKMNKKIRVALNKHRKKAKIKKEKVKQAIAAAKEGK